MQRKGFVVECKTDLDCFSRCGSAAQFKQLACWIHTDTDGFMKHHFVIQVVARLLVPGHPVSGMHYVCTHNVETYSLAGHSNKAYNEAVAASAALKDSNRPHFKVWLPDAGSKDFYLMNEPGIITHLKRHQHFRCLPLRSTLP